MKIVNANAHPVSVKIWVNGVVDYVHLAPKGKVDIEPGVTVDQNWLVNNPKVTVVASDKD